MNDPPKEEPGRDVPITAPPPSIPAPDLPYRPADPPGYRPGIGLIGCGGITKDHLTAYKAAGYRVAAMCDVDLAQAEKRRKEFFPDAAVFQDYRDLLRRDDIEVVDAATHTDVRPPIVEAALDARKHVLSQKPFVLDLDVGRRLVDLADRRGVRLAVNQNGRWAPHFAYIRAAVEAGILGRIAGAHLSVHWDHTWIAGTEFEKMRHVILYDFAIHWFDIVTCFMGGEPARRVCASAATAPRQTIRPPMLAQAMVEYEHAQASLAFDAVTKFGPQDRTYVTGDLGTICSTGPSYKVQELALYTAAGVARPKLEGCWFPDGFHGTMGELLSAIEERREPTIGAAANLKSLALCFAAVASAERNEPVVPGSVRKLPAAGGP